MIYTENTMNKFFEQFWGLFYPKSCEACGQNLLENEKILCTRCIFDIPKTHFHKQKDNLAAELFIGNVPITYATAYFYYIEGSRFRHLIHSLKYGGKPQIGTELGKMFGSALKGSFFESVDYLLPVPLHPDKKKIRGYNQSEKIAEGISQTLHKPYYTDIIERKVFTDTQTKKNTGERRENMKNVFALLPHREIEGKHLLLVDDVLTTGATLSSCAAELLKAKNVKVSIATLAIAGE